MTATVAIVTICGAEHLERCLAALAQQRGAPPFDTVVVYDPALREISDLERQFPKVRFVAGEDGPAPPELAARAVREARGETILLTEDYCCPKPDWVRRLWEAQSPEFAAVGGVVEAEDDISAVEWAFYWVDFFRYVRPVPEGASPTLTHCNISYRRSHLDAIASVWTSIFHETAVNDALQKRFGKLRLVDAEVTMHRPVTLGGALSERYRYGRLFGCTRLEFFGVGRRLYFALLTPALPALLLGRMAASALSRPRLRGKFLRSLPVLVLLTFAWSWGEWLGYLTRRRPDSLMGARKTT